VAPAAVALAVLVVAVAPEAGRMIEFRGTAVDVANADAPEDGGGAVVGGSEETGDDQKAAPGDGGGGTGGDDQGGRDGKRERGVAESEEEPQPIKFNNRLGNLVNQISPLEALGIWPSGDFRLEPGDGAVPAPIFYLGALLGLAALAVGLARWWSRGETAIPAALAAAVAVYLAARIASTPYTTAKAVLMIAPLAMLISVRGLLATGERAASSRRCPRRCSPSRSSLRRRGRACSRSPTRRSARVTTPTASPSCAPRS
jgi:hypothetical protein